MLYQKVRPIDLDQMIGNKSTVSALKTLLKQKINMPHVFLFHGPSGCGKTTLARIVANEVGCNTNSIIELNAANTRGIETIRNITKEACLLPMYSDTKCYIFDESHQLTKPAQQALLKVLEDYPKHCYFIFCTTEPQNIIKTIRNRCTEFAVSLLRKSEKMQLLNSIKKQESLSVDDIILEAIEVTCSGSPREMLVALEKVFYIEDVDEALEVLIRDSEKNSKIQDLLNILMLVPEKRVDKWQKALDVLDDLDNDSEQIRRSLMQGLYRKLLSSSDISLAINISDVMEILTQSTFSGGKPQLAQMVFSCCRDM